MKCNGQEVTPFNYRQLYPDVGADIQEEIYQAIGQGVDLAPYIEEAMSLGYDGASWLCQVRRGLVDGLSSKFFKLQSDRVLVRLRYAYNKGVDISRLLGFVSAGFSEKKWSVLVSWLLDGISSTDLERMYAIIGRVNDESLNIVDGAFRGGLPVWEVYSGIDMVSNLRVNVCLGLMRTYRWRKEFSDASWEDSVLSELLHMPYAVYNTLMTCGLCSKISYGLVQSVKRCAQEGIPEDSIARLLQVDSTTGIEVYSPWLADAVRLAYRNNYDVEPYFKVGLSREDVAKLNTQNEYSKSVQDVVGGSLYPKRQ